MPASSLTRRKMLLAITASLAPCVATAQMQTTPPRGDGGVIRLPTNQNSTQAWHLYALQKFQLDRKYGFELQIVPSATTQTTATVIQSGGAEVGLFSWIDIVRLRRSGTPMIGVAPFLQWGADFIVVPAGSTYKTIADLKGKKLGILGRTNLDWILDQTVATSLYKMNIEKDLVIQEGAVGLLRGLMETGQLDATHMFNNLTPSMVSTGKFRVMKRIKDLIAELGLPEICQLMYAVPLEYAAKKPNNVRAFVAAYREAVGILRKDDGIWDEFAKNFQMTPPAIALLRDEMRTDIWTEFKPTSKEDTRKVFSFLMEKAGPQVLGIDTLPDDFITFDYQ